MVKIAFKKISYIANRCHDNVILDSTLVELSKSSLPSSAIHWQTVTYITTYIHQATNNLVFHKIRLHN